MKLRNVLALILLCAMQANAAPVIGIERSPAKPHLIPARQANAGWSGDSMINYSGTVNTPVSSVNIDLTPIGGGGGDEDVILSKDISVGYLCTIISPSNSCFGQRATRDKFILTSWYKLIINGEFGVQRTCDFKYSTFCQAASTFGSINSAYDMNVVLNKDNRTLVISGKRPHIGNYNYNFNY